MKVSAIIPAWNEENTIYSVINAIKHCGYIDEIIVSDDGSSDHTADIAELSGATVVRSVENNGKGAAVKRAVEKCTGDIILMVDADLIGFEAKHAEALLQPVLNEICQMTIGIFRGGKLRTDLAHVVTAFLSGQRAFRRELFVSLDEAAYSGYGLETVLSYTAHKNKLKTRRIILDKVTHVTKEQKFGFISGWRARFIMYAQIIKSVIGCIR